jgi:two-component system, NtrC family, nitrogen regulation response regulator GlnG
VIEVKDLPPELTSAEAPAAAEAPPMPRSAAEPAAPMAAAPQAGGGWLADLEREARALLDAGAPEVWDTLTRRFEAQMIVTALSTTRGRRIEAAQRLGIGRNTITRKIQELGLDD